LGAASLIAAGVASPAGAIDFPKNLFDMGGEVEESESGLPLRGDESIMKKKKHGTSDKPVMKSLRYGCDPKLADQICNYNRHFAEYAGYFTTTNWLDEVDKTKETTYYDSVTGKPLFIAPRGRSFEQFVKESKVHGWPSFRDEVPHAFLLNFTCIAVDVHRCLSILCLLACMFPLSESSVGVCDEGWHACRRWCGIT
jgi:hypothetical protein